MSKNSRSGFDFIEAAYRRTLETRRGHFDERHLESGLARRWQREAAATQAASTKVATFIAWTDVAPRPDSSPQASPDRR